MNEQLITLAKSEAKVHGLDPVLVCAVVEQESAWNPYAIRYEPGFMARYVAPLYTNQKISATEAYARAFSWGLLQLMGGVSRELGYAGPIPQLCDPQTGLYWGCKELAKKLAIWPNDVKKGLLAYNGGGDQFYADSVLARMSKYKETAP